MRCDQCGKENPGQQKFCGECGARLKGAAETAPIGEPGQERSAPRSYTPAHLADRILKDRSALEGERKQVTVLFCDIADSTSLAERLGAERMHGILNAFFSLALEQVHRYEGTVNQFLGDGAQQMGFATSRVAEGQHIFAMIQKVPSDEEIEVCVYFPGQTLALKALQTFFQG